MNNKLRFGIVGTGLIANVTARAINAAETAELAAVSSRRLEGAEEFAKTHDIGKAFGSWEAMVAWDGVDAIYVATPTAAREAVCLAAAEHQKHVLGEKPFASLPSLQKITAACRDNQVAFMDATHFVHHPRTVHLKQTMHEKIGVPQAVRTSFFFPSMDRSNIRFNPAAEPTGAIGDMAWYSVRAAVEYLPEDLALDKAETLVQWDTETQAAIRGAGLLVFKNGSTSTWDAGYNVGVITMDLDILGTNGVISMDDFVLDWSSAFSYNNPNRPVGYTYRTGMATPADFQYIAAISEKPAAVHLIEDFVTLAQNPTPTTREASIAVSEQTQRFLDAAWQQGAPS